MDTLCPFVGEGEEVLPVFTSAYCRPLGEVVNCRLGAAVSGAAFATVDMVVSAMNGE